MAHKFEDTIDEEFYTADTSCCGRLGASSNVKPENIPDNVSLQIELKKIVETSSFPDEDAMTKVVARTCTAEFHKRKGYLDSEEQSALTFRELEKLFDIHLPDDPVVFANIYNIIIELEDCYIYISESCGDNFTINPAEFKYPSDDRLIIYVLNQEVLDKLHQEQEWRLRCQTMFERLTSAEHRKPVLTFHWVDSVRRGNHIFSAPQILRKLDEDGVEHILQFEGIYEADDVIDNGTIHLHKANSRHSIKLGLKTFADVGKKLKYYVYLLVHPDTHQIFYVGKGEGDRVFSHVEKVKKKLENGEKVYSKKENIIADILKSYKSPLMYIVRYNLEEDEAFLIESVLIEFLNKGLFNLPQMCVAGIEPDSDDTLSNIQGGHSLGKGAISTVEDLVFRLGSTPLRCETKGRRKNGKAIISDQVQINLLVAKLPSYIGPIKNPEDRLKRTKGSWPLSKHLINTLLKEGLYIAPAEDGIITAVYRVNSVSKWIEKLSAENRTKSDRVDFDIELLGDSDPITKELIGKNVFFNKSQFPIIYFC